MHRGKSKRRLKARFCVYTLGRIRPELNVVPSRLPSAKSTAKVPPFSRRGVPAANS